MGRRATPRDLAALLPEVYALASLATRRASGHSLYPTQVLGGIALFHGCIAEMQTGEGKTLTVVLPAALHALAGQGCHVMTANDYLARRDAELVRPIFAMLGLSVAAIQEGDSPDERRRAYAQDVTYGTAKEIAFDSLRDRLRHGALSGGPDGAVLRPHRGAAFGRHDDPTPAAVQRGLHAAMIDEADSILIDDARTPQIIAASSPVDDATKALCHWARDATAALTADRDFIWEAGRRSAHLTEAGCRRVLALAKPAVVARLDLERLYHQVECALIARHGMSRDRDYLVANGEVAIIDESTGRVMDGRKWQEGLHQAVEAQESLEITPNTKSAARITMQSFIKLYTHVAGLTGTAASARRELKRVYGCPVTVIPTYRPCIRRALPMRIFRTWSDKVRAIVEEIERLVGPWHELSARLERASDLKEPISWRQQFAFCILHFAFCIRGLTALPNAKCKVQNAKCKIGIANGQDSRATTASERRAVLVGTPSVEVSELLSAELAARQIEHQVLNCRHHEQEAEIIAAAGQAGRVTIATNMAGRGTDILLSDEVRRSGGLHVILTEMHTSARIDRQLIGRCARQGDPGSYQMFLSLEDSLLKTLPARARKHLHSAYLKSARLAEELPRTWLTFFRRAQRRLERGHLKQRRDLYRRENAQREACQRMGVDPCLELAE